MYSDPIAYEYTIIIFVIVIIIIIIKINKLFFVPVNLHDVCVEQ